MTPSPSSLLRSRYDFLPLPYSIIYTMEGSSLAASIKADQEAAQQVQYSAKRISFSKASGNVICIGRNTISIVQNHSNPSITMKMDRRVVNPSSKPALSDTVHLILFAKEGIDTFSASQHWKIVDI
jgi:hypothetical protein